MPTELPSLVIDEAITDGTGRPTLVYHKWWQTFKNTLAGALSSLEAQLAAIQAAQDAINDLDSGKQDADATLTALAGLDGTVGLVEQTGVDTFAKRGIGVASSTDVLTRADGDARYSLTGSAFTVVTRDVNASGSVNSTDYFIAVDASGGAVTLSLPSVVSSDGRILVVKKVDSSVNTVTIDGDAAETIDGAATQVLSSQYDAITIIANTTEWGIV